MGLVIVTQRYSRQYVADETNRLGCRELADEASRELPDPVDIERLANWCLQHGLTHYEEDWSYPHPSSGSLLPCSRGCGFQGRPS
jgi:hypothetical protein